MNSPLLRLPSELLGSILQFASTDENISAGLRDLINASKTCTVLHHAVFCITNDRLLWYPLAASLGIPPTVALDDLLYAGTSAVQKRQWIHVVRLNYSWAQPFPSSSSSSDQPATMPVLQRARGVIPRPWWRINPARRKTVQMCVAEEGSTASPSYIAAHAAARNGGVALFGARYCDKAVSPDNGLLDPALVVPAYVYPKLCEDESQFSPCLGFVESRGKEGGEVRISEMAPEQKRRVVRTWNTGMRKFLTFKTCGDMSVGLCRVPVTLEGTDPSARSLVCLRATDGDKCNVVWEHKHVYGDWEDTEDDYMRYPRIRNFHMTSTHVVCLVTRSPDHSHAKLTRIEFRVLDLRTGETCRTMVFSRQPISSHPGMITALTTVLEHDFILTDKFVVSGGQGGELLVWDYRTTSRASSTVPNTSSDALLYAIPVWCSSSSSDNAGSSRTWSALTISVDGRYLGAMVSDQLFIIDMVEKTVAARYHNGRLVRPRDRYVKNPRDDFAGGIWCWWKEWESQTDPKSGEQTWQEVPNGDGVTYLAGIVEEGRWIDPDDIPKYITSAIALSAFCLDNRNFMWLLAMLSPFVVPLLVAWLLPVEWALRLRM
ncbi:hypothetical protein BZA05DRAFT_356996 [Tricharina praecox]|uniref:uncharacterized protein n=1 Tax=Tricharina praecox TaxID=43433 RepID=UPI00221FC22A|nr:uncharacterized protein BZA05DRAFT_356996 [Tricharina praecox]KAI5846955.1 hypothetical protein BZA05DRAFT_356996 [Tricharina praecox]